MIDTKLKQSDDSVITITEEQLGTLKENKDNLYITVDVRPDVMTNIMLQGDTVDNYKELTYQDTDWYHSFWDASNYVIKTNSEGQLDIAVSSTGIRCTEWVEQVDDEDDYNDKGGKDVIGCEFDDLEYFYSVGYFVKDKLYEVTTKIDLDDIVDTENK